MWEYDIKICSIYFWQCCQCRKSETFVAGAREHPHAHCYFPIITLHTEHKDSTSEVGF